MEFLGVAEPQDSLRCSRCHPWAVQSPRSSFGCVHEHGVQGSMHKALILHLASMNVKCDICSGQVHLSKVKCSNKQQATCISSFWSLEAFIRWKHANLHASAITGCKPRNSSPADAENCICLYTAACAKLLEDAKFNASYAFSSRVHLAAACNCIR